MANVAHTLGQLTAESYKPNRPIKKAAEFKRTPKDKPLDGPPAAKDLVEMDSLRARLADYMAPASWGGERAGRAQAMADAIGEKTTFEVKYPLLAGLLYGAAGSALGTGAGGLAGGLAGLLGGLASNSHNIDRIAGSGAIIGAGLGSGVGALGGAYLSGKNRRNEMKRINHFYDQDREAGKLQPKTPELSALAALLLPLRGPHRSGQLEASRAMKGEKTLDDSRGVLRDPLYATRMMVPYFDILHGYGQNIRTQLGASEDRDRERAAARA